MNETSKTSKAARECGLYVAMNAMLISATALVAASSHSVAMAEGAASNDVIGWWLAWCYAVIYEGGAAIVARVVLVAIERGKGRAEVAPMLAVLTALLGMGVWVNAEHAMLNPHHQPLGVAMAAGAPIVLTAAAVILHHYRAHLSADAASIESIVSAAVEAERLRIEAETAQEAVRKQEVARAARAQRTAVRMQEATRSLPADEIAAAEPSMRMLSSDERLAEAERMYALNPDITGRQVADALGVDVSTGVRLRNKARARAAAEEPPMLAAVE